MLITKALVQMARRITVMQTTNVSFFVSVFVVAVAVGIFGAGFVACDSIGGVVPVKISEKATGFHRSSLISQKVINLLSLPAI